jgi:hypothetical protein
MKYFLRLSMETSAICLISENSLDILVADDLRCTCCHRLIYTMSHTRGNPDKTDTARPKGY